MKEENFSKPVAGKIDETEEYSQNELRGEQREKEKLLEQNQALVSQNEQLKKDLEDIPNSRSWRLTSPLRYVAWAAGAFLPLIRFKAHRFSVEPGTNVTPREGQLEIVGPNASLRLIPQSGEIPSGWMTIRYSLSSPRGAMYFILYARIQRASGELCFRVLFSEGKGEAPLFKFPEGVSEIRLEPVDAYINFSLSDFELCEKGKLQVGWLVLKECFAVLASDPRALLAKLGKWMALMRKEGLAGLREKFNTDETAYDYQEWVKKYDTLTDHDRELIREHIATLSRTPLISIVMPTYNTPPALLRAAIESVFAQLYPNWELCIRDDHSTEPGTRGVLEEYARRDSRVKVELGEERGHISQASNSALKLVCGDYVTFLDHDDELTEHALYMVACELNSHPDADLLYSDEDKITEQGLRFHPHFKPDWNPDLLLVGNYVAHLAVYRTSLVRNLGGLRTGFEGAQDWDLVLRVSELVPLDRIRHIPHVLYHWRAVEGSTALSISFKPYAMKAQVKTVGEHLERLGEQARVDILTDMYNLRVNFDLPSPAPHVTIIIPTRDQARILERCVRSILERSDYPAFDILIVNNRSEQEETFLFFEKIEATGRVKVIDDNLEFNYSRINNFAVTQARGELIAFLNNDLEVISPDWLSEMVSHACRRGVGAVGARLLYANGLLQHGGIILGIGGVAGHNHKWITRQGLGYFQRAILLQNLSAVTAACIVMRKSIFEEVGGFDEVEFPIGYNDVDLCLRIREHGYRITYTPYAELYHYESVSRGYENTPEKSLRLKGEADRMKRRWGDLLQRDPYYNPNLTLLNDDFALASPPRAEKPWRSSRA